MTDEHPLSLAQMQEIHKVSKETCDEHMPNAVRKELKYTVWMLSGCVVVIGIGIMLIINMLRDDISVQGKDIRSQGETLNKIYEVASRLEITDARVGVTESDIIDLKKKTTEHYVKQQKKDLAQDMRLTALENRNKLVENNR